MSLRRIWTGRGAEHDPDPLRNPTGGTTHDEGRGPLRAPPPPPTRKARKARKAREQSRASSKPRRAARPRRQATPLFGTSRPAPKRKGSGRKAKQRRSSILGRSSGGSRRSTTSKSIVGRGKSPLAGGKKIGGRGGGMPTGKKIW
jgi:hypothetical protein